MNEQIPPELLVKARTAESPEALLALAEANGVPLSAEEARTRFDLLHQTGEVSDEELENVSGGGCGGGNTPKFQVGDLVCRRFGFYPDSLGCRKHYKKNAADSGGTSCMRIANVYPSDDGKTFYYDFRCAVRDTQGYECCHYISGPLNAAYNGNRYREDYLRSAVDAGLA